MSNPKWFMVLPSLKVSGGTLEAIRLAKDLDRGSEGVQIVSMWHSNTSVDPQLPTHFLADTAPSVSRAPLELVGVFLRFRHRLRNGTLGLSTSRFVFTHYATLPLAFLVRRDRRYFFVQDLEWKFVGSRLASFVLKRVILYFYRRGHLLSANPYLSSRLAELGLSVRLEVPIWASGHFLVEECDLAREFDFAMVLRKGAHKRLDLYLQFLELCQRDTTLKVAVVTPDETIANCVRERVALCLVHPSQNAMRDVYARTKCFVHLSEHEGFGLPPLEAMGAGCVPLCRDSGGVRAFMAIEPLPSLLLPFDVPVEEVFRVGRSLISGGDLAALSAASRSTFARGLLLASERATRIKKLDVTRDLA